MMNVPWSVIQGKLPRNTVCSRISPVSRFVNATFTFTGTSYVEVLLAALAFGHDRVADRVFTQATIEPPEYVADREVRSMVSRRPDVFSELGSLGSPMNHRNDAFWMSIRLGTIEHLLELGEGLTDAGRGGFRQSKASRQGSKGIQAGRIRTKGATENPIRGRLLTQTRSVSPAAGWASATGYLQSLYRKPPGGQVHEPRPMKSIVPSLLWRTRSPVR